MIAINVFAACAVGSGVGFVASAGVAAKRRATGLGYLAALVGAVLGRDGGYVLGFVLCIVLGSSLLVAFASGTSMFCVVALASAAGGTLLGIALVDHATRPG